MTFKMSTLHAMGLENSRGYYSTELEEPLTRFMDNSTALNSLFRGNKPLKPSIRYQGLISEQVDRLADMDIETQKGDVFVGGLVTIKLKANTQLDLVAFKDLIDQKILSALHGPELGDLIRRYLILRKEIYVSSGKSQDVRQPFKELHECMQDIGYFLLPEDFLSLLENPNGFIETTLHRVGYYALTTIQELGPMLDYGFQEEDGAELQDLVDDLDMGVLIAPNTTPLEDRSSEEEYPPERKYPSSKQTRKFNERRAIESKARLASRLYDEIRPRLKHMTPREKRQKIGRIRSLRPSIRTLRAYYRARGDSPKIANMLVTPKTYPDLPQVWLTKRQQAVLLDVLEGKAEQHADFITNGFK